VAAPHAPARSAGRPKPAPQQRQPESHEPPAREAFPAPTTFSFGTPQRPQRFAEAGPRAEQAGAPTLGQFARVVRGHVGEGWLEALHRWWASHGYYPEPAAERGEDGIVGIEIVVDRSGHVDALDLLSRSGSTWLDLGAQAVFRGANLPPLPPGSDDQISVDLAIHYILIRRLP
jgi:protein TonB